MSPRFSRRWTRRAAGKRKDIERADRMLSEAFVAYVARPEQDPGLGIHLCRRGAEADAAIAARGAAQRGESRRRSSTYVHDMGWMNPVYGELRQALANHQYATTSSATCSS